MKKILTLIFVCFSVFKGLAQGEANNAMQRFLSEQNAKNRKYKVYDAMTTMDSTMDYYCICNTNNSQTKDKTTAKVYFEGEGIKKLQEGECVFRSSARLADSDGTIKHPPKFVLLADKITPIYAIYRTWNTKDSRQMVGKPPKK